MGMDWQGIEDALDRYKAWGVMFHITEVMREVLPLLRGDEDLDGVQAHVSHGMLCFWYLGKRDCVVILGYKKDGLFGVAICTRDFDLIDTVWAPLGEVPGWIKRYLARPDEPDVQASRQR
jgi:hypothetical protein